MLAALGCWPAWPPITLDWWPAGTSAAPIWRRCTSVVGAARRLADMTSAPSGWQAGRVASLSGWPAKLDVELAETVAELGRWPAVMLDR